jgi:hypothetical protein
MFLDSFWNRVQQSDGCWNWTGGKNNQGYGNFAPQRRVNLLAHRFSWEFHHRQQIPPGMLVCHTCDNPSCVNPAHLFLGSQGDNHADKLHKLEIKRLRAAGVTELPPLDLARRDNGNACWRGHAYTPENTTVNRLGRKVCRTCDRQRRKPRLFGKGAA